ncbi:MAG: hypothetical protein PF572_00275 [Patescibacteria group bacterium]|nr:hypothetical protein [Patescibacteria group bacterium]
MQEGTISRVMHYYLEKEVFNTEIERAKKEFFSVSENGSILTIKEDYEPFFLEWLVFDFKLTNGDGLFEDYYLRNPKKLPLYEMQIYKNLQNNIYGLLEVKSVDIGKGLEILILHTGKKYYIEEHNATFQLVKGNIFFGRIADVGGHWELVGSDSFMFDIRINDGYRKSFLKGKKKITPKDAILFLTKSKNSEKKEEGDIEKIKIEFDDFLREIGLNDMVNSDLIQKWLKEINFKNIAAPIVDIIYNLSEDELSKKDINRLIELSSSIMNSSPRKELKGETPDELSKTHEFGSKGVDMSLNRIGGKWSDNANKAIVYMKNNDIPKALDEFDKMFKILLKEKMVNRYIYKLFANLAMCNLAIGEEYIARQLLGFALELNRKYKFAANTLKKLDSGENIDQLALPIRFTLEHARTKEMKDFWEKVKNLNDKDLCQAYYDISLNNCIFVWENSPAKKYYEFLKKFEINFELTNSD